MRGQQSVNSLVERFVVATFAVQECGACCRQHKRGFLARQVHGDAGGFAGLVWLLLVGKPSPVLREPLPHRQWRNCPERFGTCVAGLLWYS